MDRRRLSASAAVTLDVVLAVVFGGLGVWRELTQPADVVLLVPSPLWLRLAVQLLGAAALLGRRRHPLTVAAFVAALCLVSPAQAVFPAAYALTAFATHRGRAVAGSAVLGVCFCLGATIWTLDDPVSGPAVIALAGVLGLYVRARRGLYDALLERARRAEREQALLAEQAAAEERTRLAAEMHDVVSHRVSLMVLQAGALGSVSADPVVREAAEDLREAGVRALAELRDVVGVLRTKGRASDEEAPPEATEDAASDLTRLVGEWAAVGADVELDESGDIGRIAPTVRRTAYRVVEEAVTNAGKHAPGGRVVVRAAYDECGAELSVRNERATGVPDESLRAVGGGAGLAGLRARVELVGGSMSAAPHPEGGYEVSARLPAYVPTRDADVREVRG